MRFQRTNTAKISVAAVLLACLASIERVAHGSGYWDDRFGLPGADLGVADTIVARDQIYVAGGFSTVGGVAANQVARWDGTNWFALGDGVSGGVYALAADTRYLYIAGTLSSAGGQLVSNIARWDGTNWSGVGGGVNAVVFALASDGQNLYAGGHFTTAGGVPASKIARWDGSNWYPLGQGIIPVSFGGTVVGAVDSIAVGRGSVFVGGRFRNAGGLAATNIARWDGTNWYSLGEGLRYVDGGGSENGAVRTLLVQNGATFAGGSFRIAGTTQASNIAQWNGTNWSPLGSGVDDSFSVLAMAASGSGLYAGGSFIRIGGVVARAVAFWDGHSWSNLGAGIDSGGVSALCSTGTELFMGGQFQSVDNVPSYNIAMYHIPHSLDIQRAQNGVTLSWPATGTNFVLEACAALGQTEWQLVPEAPVIVGSQCVVTKALAPANQFYRLRRK